MRGAAAPPLGTSTATITAAPGPGRRRSTMLKTRDPDAYAHVYLGFGRHTLDGAVYARELREATERGRIGSIPYDPTMPVSVYLDLGCADSMSIRFAQHIAGEIRLIDFHQDSWRPFDHYLGLLHGKHYTVWRWWRAVRSLPCMGWSAGGSSICASGSGRNTQRAPSPLCGHEPCVPHRQAGRGYRADWRIREVLAEPLGA